MVKLMKMGVTAALLGVTSLAATQPAQAHDNAGVAIAAGVIGLGVGAAIASDHPHYRAVQYGGGYYEQPYGYYQQQPYSYGYGYGDGYRRDWQRQRYWEQRRWQEARRRQWERDRWEHRHHDDDDDDGY